MTQTSDAIGYVACYWDNETQLYYLQSRYYCPALRRFISADVYMDTGVGILGTNMYVYCNNDPINLYDPTGYKPKKIPKITMQKQKSAAAALPLSSPVSQERNPIANHVTRTHVTTPEAMLDGGPLWGRIGFSSTGTTPLPGTPEPALFYSYSAFGTTVFSHTTTTAYGVGIGGWLEMGVGASAEGNVFTEFQLTPWLHGGSSVGVDGRGWTVGVYLGNDTTFNLELQAGVGSIAAGAVIVKTGGVVLLGLPLLPAFAR